jgi:23S rRNA G2069 N7-methylase RlmK/C1962 C5-methylase RlmI
MLIQLINDQYGNYVMKQLYSKCTEPQKLKILTIVKKLNESQVNNYGNKYNNN